ncbi:hypothetical protein I5R11_16555 [Serratia marcescens]|jgi:hypothetical protein|nr:hypothetical protein [Serratia marcescens]
MSDNPTCLNIRDGISDWITIREAVRLLNGLNGCKIRKSDFYRFALQGKIRLSIYFQSPVTLRKIKSQNHKLKLRPIKSSSTMKSFTLAESSFVSENNLTFSTEGRYIHPVQRVIDTTLLGYEYVLIQRLLAHSLKIPSPVTGATSNNYGITVCLLGETFQLFEKMTWHEKIERHVKRLPKDISSDDYENIIINATKKDSHKYYFPMYELPSDACFVLRKSELDKLINKPIEKEILQPSPTRISTPLSRLFWLACKNNETISPLIMQPYKLLSIFEQWASEEGITDRFSGDTLKTALERGSPPSLPTQK